MKLGIRYQTEYRYDQPVGFSTHEIRLFPKANRFLHLCRLDFQVSPRGAVRYLQDVFDNTVAACAFAEREAKLQLNLDLDLELEERNPFDFLLEQNAVTLPFPYAPDLQTLLQPYRTRRYDGDLNIPGWTVPTKNKSRDTVGALVELNQAIHHSMVYERREEGSARAPAETLRIGGGACRDVAILHAEMLRDLGLAARLVSGYLRATDEKTRRAAGSLHAWTEVFLPGAGWIGMDATNGIFCNHNFIVAAVGLIPADITPISGNYYHRENVPAQMTSRLEMLDL